MPEISEADLKTLNDAKKQLTTLETTMKTIKGELDGLKAAKVDLEHKLDDADKELLSESYLDFKNKGKVKPTDKGGDFDFDTASGKEIAEHLAGKSKVELKSAMKEINDRIGDTEKQMGKAFARLDVTLTALQHTDFNPNKEAIYKIAQENPSWGAAKCYKQFKLETKATDDQKKIDDEAKEKEDNKALTEKGEDGLLKSTVTNKDLSPEDAADAAYKEAFGNSEKA